MIHRYFEDETTAITIRLTDLLTLNNAFQKKKELVQLLDRLEALSAGLQNDVQARQAEAKKSKLLLSEVALGDTMQLTAVAGQIVVLRRMITLTIDRIDDVEQSNKLTQEQEAQVERAKRNDDLSYFG